LICSSGITVFYHKFNGSIKQVICLGMPLSSLILEHLFGIQAMSMSTEACRLEGRGGLVGHR